MRNHKTDREKSEKMMNNILSNKAFVSHEKLTFRSWLLSGQPNDLYL